MSVRLKGIYDGFVYNTFGQSVSIADSVYLVGASDDSDLGSVAGASHFYEFTPNPVSALLQIDNVERISKILIYNSMGVKLKELDLKTEIKWTFQNFNADSM